MVDTTLWAQINASIVAFVTPSARKCCHKDKTFIDFGSVLHGDNSPICLVAVCLPTIQTPYACHHVIGFLTRRSVFVVEPCEVILRDVLAPVAGIRNRKRTHLASLACGLPRILGILPHCLPASVCVLVLLPVHLTFDNADQCLLRPLVIPTVSSHTPLLIASTRLLRLHFPHLRSKSHLTRSTAHFLLTSSSFPCSFFFSSSP